MSNVLRSVRSRRRHDFRCRPSLELLEDRTAPATLAGLGAASTFAVLDVNGGDLTIAGSSVVGNVGVGPHGTGALHRDSVTGAVDVAFTASLHHPAGGSVSISGGIVAESLAQAQSDANAASAAYEALAPTQSFGNRTASLAVTGNGGTNVIDVTSIDFSHKTLTLSGGANDLFIFNVAHDVTFDHSQIVLTGGVTANHVIFNFTHAASTIDLTNSAINATFLAPHGTVTVTNSASFHGELVAKDIHVRASAQLTAAGFAPPVVAGTSLSGFVYQDVNNDHVREPSEPGEAGVVIDLTGVDAAGNAVSLTTVTAADGSYTFANLAAGTYQLTEALPPFDTKGTNAVGTVNGAADGALIGNQEIGSIVLNVGDVGVEYDFAVIVAGG